MLRRKLVVIGADMTLPLQQNLLDSYPTYFCMSTPICSSGIRTAPLNIATKTTMLSSISYTLVPILTIPTLGRLIP
jgi:hypothetical protein